MPPSDTEWVRDEANKRWIQWSSSQRRWVDERDRPVDRESAAAASSKLAALDETTTAFARLNVNAVGGARQTASYTGTARDRVSGLSTTWNVSRGIPYRDPQNAQTGRSITTKYIRASGNSSGDGNANSSNTYRVGWVIEVLLVPPEAADPAAVSGITPRGEQDGVRLKRFVIVQSFPEQNRFRALPIKTYNGRGVAAPGVVKSHHSIIYTDSEPSPLSDERPLRLQSNQMEDPMQPQAILVSQFDLTTALDPRSRLDYGSDYRLDFGVPNIRPFGRVHPDSLPILFAQWHSVFNAIRSNAASGSGVTSHTIVPTIPIPTTGGANRLPRASTGSAPRDDPEGRLLIQQFGSRNSGQCTEPQMQRILTYLDEYARQRNLRRPNMNAAARMLPELSRNSERRADYIQHMRNQWAQDAARAQEDDDDDDDEDGDEESDEGGEDED